MFQNNDRKLLTEILLMNAKLLHSCEGAALSLSELVVMRNV